MGCDIHSFAEVKINGTWEPVLTKPFKNPYYNSERPTVIEDDYEWNAEKTNQPYTGRNYDLFAILADVRNGRGFAGIKTGEGFNPISEPKGLPDDVTDYTEGKSEEWGEDGHSHSFFTVKELKDYDWHQVTMKRAVLSLQQYKEIKDNGTVPDCYSADVSGGNVVKVEEHEADMILDGKLPNTLYFGKEIYVIYHWAIKYADHCQFFLNDTIPSLESLGDPEDVRIVFFFDN